MPQPRGQMQPGADDDSVRPAGAQGSVTRRRDRLGLSIRKSQAFRSYLSIFQQYLRSRVIPTSRSASQSISRAPHSGCSYASSRTPGRAARKAGGRAPGGPGSPGVAVPGHLHQVALPACGRTRAQDLGQRGESQARHINPRPGCSIAAGTQSARGPHLRHGGSSFLAERSHRLTGRLLPSRSIRCSSQAMIAG